MVPKPERGGARTRVHRLAWTAMSVRWDGLMPASWGEMSQSSVPPEVWPWNVEMGLCQTTEFELDCGTMAVSSQAARPVLGIF